MVITVDDLLNDEIKEIIEAKGTAYYDLTQSLYENWLRQYEVIDDEDLPADADVDPMVKLALVYWIYQIALSDNFVPTALQSFDTSPTLNENPLEAQYNQYKALYDNQIQFINPDSLLQRSRRSAGRTGTRVRA